MAQSIRVSDDLYDMAQNASQALGRSLAQQMEYWARLGAALDAAGISAPAAMTLLGNGVSADGFVAAALGRVVSGDGGLPSLKDRQRKDAEDVIAGRRSARSLWAIQKGDLDGFVFKFNRNSEFDRAAESW
ncbi:MAG: hypothetical protein JF607_22355 [Burkholderiales bacterium]|jgi:hypothetical protein|nr:hypothetical protein [Burkholderiales bacterium]